MTSATSSEQIPAYPLEILNLGRIAYGEALNFQKRRLTARQEDRVGDTLLLLEHEAVITMGSSGEHEHLQVSEDTLNNQGIPIFWVERGGMATYHGPGQLVAYPIIKLQIKDLHLYLDKLLNAVATTISSFGLKAQKNVNGTGLWVDNAKIASVGIAVRKWVTFHGIALNINTDMQGFKFITPCGNAQERMTSLQELLGYELDIEQVSKIFTKAFAEEFNFSLNKEATLKRPKWLTVTLPSLKAMQEVENVEHTLDGLNLHTVCQEAMCPNKGECFARGTATFIIMGDICTRNCRYCAVTKGKPNALDEKEPQNVAKAVKQMGLSHAVITSVTRDDLEDGGAEHFVKCIQNINTLSPKTSVEVLVPDFQENYTALDKVCKARPHMFNHNLETVARLFPQVRPKASYIKSLKVLAYAAQYNLKIKSGVMLGLGESFEEIRNTLKDLYTHGCRYLTLGQYLAPSTAHVPIARYVAEDEFEHWKEVALEMGFVGVASAPLVRSSYRAEAMHTAEKI